MSACTAEMQSTMDRFSIENGFWDCKGLGETVSSMSCKAKCSSGALNFAKSEIKAKCKDPPALKLKNFDEGDLLKCEEQPDPCDGPISELNIEKGTLELLSSNAKKGNQYNLICDDGETIGTVKCKNGKIFSKITDFERWYSMQR